AEQVGEFHRLANPAVIRPVEDIVTLQFAAEWQRAALFRERLRPVDQVLFVLEERIARGAIVVALVGIAKPAHGVPFVLLAHPPPPCLAFPRLGMPACSLARLGRYA